MTIDVELDQLTRFKDQPCKLDIAALDLNDLRAKLQDSYIRLERATTCKEQLAADIKTLQNGKH